MADVTMPGRSVGLSAGIQLFASSGNEPRSRRPTDVVLAIGSVLSLVIAATVSTLAAELEESLANVVAAVPGVFDALWAVGFWVPVIWAGVLVVAALVRRRVVLAGELLLAAVIVFAVSAALVAMLSDSDDSVVSLLLDIDGPPVFPPGAVVLAVTAVTTASPHLARPYRHFGRWIIGFQAWSAILLGTAVPTGTIAAVAVGFFSAAVVHLAFGSPGGRPTATRIRQALSLLGVDARDLSPATMQSAGVVRFTGSDEDGPLLIKIYGRDAWDAQLLANLWRVTWYRSTERTARLSRVELVEHEAFVTLLADRAGVAVPTIVTAGNAGQGDALVVVRPIGPPLATVESPDESIRIESLWEEIARLHDAGIVHRQLDLDRVLVASDGRLAFGDLSSATVTGFDADRFADRAQALVLTILVAGEEPALAAARHALGDDAVAELLPYVQTAAMAPLVRKELDRRDLEVDDLRKRLASAMEVEEPEIIKLRRVTVGSLVNLALLGLAAFTILTLFSDFDLDSFVEALKSASWAWVAFAMVLAQLPRFPGAVSTLGATAWPLPLGPLTALQFAICYVNLAIPSTAARVAVNIRFFERFGIPPTGAVSAGLIDSVSGFVIQILLFLLLFFGADVSLDLTTDTSDLSGLLTIALIALGVIVVAVLVVLFVPSVRARVKAWYGEAKYALRVFRSPQKMLQLFGGNLVAQVLFGVAFGAAVRAFGYDIPVTELLLINTVVSLFAGLLPIPGGMGVSEAGLTLGLTKAGVPQETALAIAVTYRLGSFYLPPIWGFFCYRWLVKKRYL